MDRTRRLRQTAVMRSMVRENHVRTEELIYPLFVMEGENIVQPVESMPGICQYSVDRMNEELDRVKALQIPATNLFSRIIFSTKGTKDSASGENQLSPPTSTNPA